MLVRYSSTTDSPEDLMPRLPLTLNRGNRAVGVQGLLDSGASVNLLPYSVGLALGGRWDEQRVLRPLSGAFGRIEVRGLLVAVSEPDLTDGVPVQLTFAWANVDTVPVIFGQMNFFMEFKVCFYRSEAVFEVTRNQRD
jgi:hypothetical protein